VCGLFLKHKKEKPDAEFYLPPFPDETDVLDNAEFDTFEAPDADPVAEPETRPVLEAKAFPESDASVDPDAFHFEASPVPNAEPKA